jgi:alpha-aminoadipic semialdehyde synthase
VPLTPVDAGELITDLGIEITIQPSELRVFPEAQYQEHKVRVDQDLKSCDLILGIKEIKTEDLISEKVYCYFSHTVKGQSYNMAMLQKLMDLKCTLIDYERMANEKGQRLIYFSVHAGLAGIVESLWAYGKQMALKGIANPFEKMQQTFKYKDLNEIKSVFKEVGQTIRTHGLPQGMQPLVVGITGYGNVARGVQELLDILPIEQIPPSALKGIGQSGNVIYKVVFKESDMVEPIDAKSKFDLQEYYSQPEKYRSKFEPYLPYMDVLINASFWDTQYPRHVPNAALRRLYELDSDPKLKLIGDISCDIDGGVQCTVKATDPGNPVFTYYPLREAVEDGLSATGIAVMAVDNLPSELPKDASEYFSGVLKTLIPDLIKTDFTNEFDKLDLPDELKRAVIVHQGQLTPDYLYLQQYL